MGEHTRIDWCEATWNPVTGCLHGCTYCYAEKIANRFSGHAPIENLDDYCKWPPENGRLDCGDCQKCNHVLNEPFRCSSTYKYMQIADINTGKIEPYPYGFNPTFHRYRLDEPQKWKKPRNIFVCSMADLFGEWVPDDWIKDVFEACIKAPQHRYLFLTKNTKRYKELAKNLDWYEDYFTRGNFWFGTTIEHPSENLEFGSPYVNSFISIEPILSAPDETVRLSEMRSKWVIIGAETGNRKGKIVPKREWIERVTEFCDYFGAKVFMKESLRELIGDDFRQEFPWEV